ncbi:MAG: hypothetical protein HQL87_14880 [Magnetococcales bacterium]|nr:hypothetical protein [Magnetococcales bacterium]
MHSDDPQNPDDPNPGDKSWWRPKDIGFYNGTSGLFGLPQLPKDLTDEDFRSAFSGIQGVMLSDD